MISRVSLLAQRQIETYAWLLPQLQEEGVDLNAIPGILDQTLRHAHACRGASFIEAAERLNTWIRANDYVALHAHLTNPADENEPLRVISAEAGWLVPVFCVGGTGGFCVVGTGVAGAG